jgi:hypothetical protein
VINLTTFAAHHRLRLIYREMNFGVSNTRNRMFPLSFHWKCAVVTGRGRYRRRLRCTYSQGAALSYLPTLENVLQALKNDALAFVNHPTYDDFQRNYGGSMLTYLSCQKVHKSLSRLLAGDHVRDYLLYEIDSE